MYPQKFFLSFWSSSIPITKIIKPKNKRALYWKGAAHPVKKVNHPGSKAKPYLIPAFEKEIPYFIDKLKEVVEW